jgi:hypothetical protein
LQLHVRIIYYNCTLCWLGRPIKPILRIILICLAIALAILLGYGIWRLLRQYWAPVLLFSHLLVGAIIALGSIVTLYRTRRQWSRDALHMLAREAQSQSIIPRLRDTVTRLLDPLTNFTGGWTVAAYHGLKGAARPRGSLLHVWAEGALAGIVAKFGPATLLTVILAYAIEYLFPTDLYWTKIFLYVTLMHIFLRHVGYLLNVVPLPTQLRRSAGNPYVSFVVLALTDLFSLLLVLHAIMNWQPTEGHNIPDYSAVLVLCKDFFFGSVSDVISEFMHSGEPKFLQIIVAASGIIYSVTILETAYHFNKFKRTDEDRIAIAGAYCHARRYSEAISALEKCQTVTSDLYMVRASAHLGVNLLNRAWDDVKRILDIEGVQATPAQIFLKAMNCISVFRVPSSAVTGLVKRGIENSIPDLTILAALNNLLMIRNENRQDDTWLATSILPLFADVAVAERLPLSHIQLLIQTQSLDDARQRLQIIIPGDGSQKIVYWFQILIVNITDSKTTIEQDAIFFGEWNLKYFTDVSLTISSINAGEIDDAVLGLLIGVLVRLTVLSRQLGSDYDQSWQFVLNEIKKSIAIRKNGPALLNLINQIEELAKSEFGRVLSPSSSSSAVPA